MKKDSFDVGGVREPFAGRIGFYPQSSNELAAQIDYLLSGVEKIPLDGDIVGCMVPHAGYSYSGEIAARVYKQLIGEEFETVLIFAPPHRVYRQEPTFDTVSAYLTPLGKVSVDQELIGRLVSESPLFAVSRQPHVQEHSVEVQVPFLQSVLKPGFKIAPAVVGDMTFEQLHQAAKIISDVCKGKNILLIASTDLSHYFRYDQAREMDRLGMELIASYDPEMLYKKLMMGETEMCGGFATVLVMLTARELGAIKAIELGYMNSGDITGDKSSVVGYGAALFVTGRKKKSALKSEEWIGEEEKKELLSLVRSTLESALSGKGIPDYTPVHEKLYEKRGAFVTLKTRDGKLRGCIGHIAADKPLFRVVQEMAVAAARQDPRFPPVELNELEDIEVEISILSALEEVKKPEEIEVGKHGLLVQKGLFSGLLLPQVAVEWRFDREEFLRQTCLKAGLEPDEWKDAETKVWKFTAQIFSESELE